MKEKSGTILVKDASREWQSKSHARAILRGTPPPTSAKLNPYKPTTNQFNEQQNILRQSCTSDRWNIWHRQGDSDPVRSRRRESHPNRPPRKRGRAGGCRN